MDDQFEENLREILSPGPVSKKEEGDAAPATLTRPVIRPTHRYLEEAADRYEKEQKALFWLKIIRPIAFIALLGLLALFVQRITSFGM
jgi:hypothetical protein